MKKIILAIDNKKILNKIKEINNFNLIIKNVQYREAILEILKKEKNINFILINEKLSGEISIEELIIKIKIINKKINIIVFLEKSDIKKENKLKKLGIKNIYINNKINKNKILNLIKENKINKLEKRKNNSEKVINKKYNENKSKENTKIINKKINNYINKNIESNQNKKIQNKILTFYGEEKSGKSTIINLLIIYLIEKNKKILLINFNKKIEKNYLIKLNKNYLKNKKEKNKILKYKIIEKRIIKNNNNKKNSQNKINENLKIINNLENNFKKNNQKNNEVNFKFLIDKYKNTYDYILFNISYQKEFKNKKEILKLSNKKIIIINKKLLGIQAIKKEINSEEKRKLDIKKDLHIIQNKYYFNSISNLIIKNLFKDFCHVHKIPYSKNYINLNQENLENKKIKINKSTKKIFEKIIN